MQTPKMKCLLNARKRSRSVPATSMEHCRPRVSHAPKC